MKTAVYASLAVLLCTLVTIVLSGCPLDPAKVPPCTGGGWPDPCAAGPRDAGVDG